MEMEDLIERLNFVMKRMVHITIRMTPEMSVVDDEMKKKEITMTDTVMTDIMIVKQEMKEVNIKQI